MAGKIFPYRIQTESNPLERESKRERQRILPPSHNDSPIFQRRLHRIIPPPFTLTIMRPSLQNRKLLVEITINEG